MRILWLVNLALPEASQLMGINQSPFGGWLINASKELSKHEDIELSIAFPSNKAGNFKELKGKTINYYPFVPIKDNDIKSIEYNETFRELLDYIKPDLVHIYGTEYLHTLSMVNTCNRLNIETVISIQGLVSVIESHIYASLPTKVIYGKTLRNLFFNDNVSGTRKKYKKRGKSEIQAIESAKHVIGRTTWDKACVSQINPYAEYHFCNETLREEFYKHKWNINECEEYSIFLSQASNSIKGLHFMLDAMDIIIKRYPMAKLYIGGKNIIKRDSIKDLLEQKYYAKYVGQKMEKMKLKDKVIFTGPLNEEEMCQRYLKSNVFVSPSSIENSPNSVGEAMILGVPCVASYVGGTPDMLKDKEDGFLYQHDAPYMLAHYVGELFDNRELALEFSKNSRAHALKTHDKMDNTKRTIEIYKSIVDR